MRSVTKFLAGAGALGAAATLATACADDVADGALVAPQAAPASVTQVEPNANAREGRIGDQPLQNANAREGRVADLISEPNSNAREGRAAVLTEPNSNAREGRAAVLTEPNANAREGRI
jgi:hypothetical protein